LKRWYNLINKKFFDNQLPTNTCVRWINELEQEKFEEMYFAWTSNIEGTVARLKLKGIDGDPT